MAPLPQNLVTPRGSFSSGRNSPTGVTSTGSFSKSSSTASLIRVPSVGPAQQQQVAEQVCARLRRQACSVQAGGGGRARPWPARSRSSSKRQACRRGRT